MTDSRIPGLATVRSPPQRTLRYESLRGGAVIGQGGHSIVRRVELPEEARPPTEVAVKEPLAPTGSVGLETTEQFLSTAETWARIDTIEREKAVYDGSSHIVGVVDVGDGLPWVAMEYMDGGSLADRLEAHPDGLPIDEALWIGERLCRALEVAHDPGIAHLDLKPANVLFRNTSAETWDLPKVGDWGLARAVVEPAERENACSAEYAAPEQFDAEFGSADTYTDVYQLGAVVYAMLTGRPPYTGGQAEIMHAVLSGDESGPTPPSDHRDDLPPAVDDVVLTALRRAKGDRYRGKVDRFGDALHDLRAEFRSVTDKATTEKGGKRDGTEAKTAPTDRSAKGARSEVKGELLELGFATVGDLAQADIETLTSLDGVDKDRAKKLQTDAKEHIPNDSSRSVFTHEHATRVNSNQTHFDRCPECGEDTVWFGQIEDTRHLECEACGAAWVKESGVEWREYHGPNEGRTKPKQDWLRQTDSTQQSDQGADDAERPSAGATAPDEQSIFDNDRAKRLNPNQTHFEECPECHADTVWFAELHGDRHLECKSCGAGWVKENDTDWREYTGPNEGTVMSKNRWVGS